MIRSDLTGIILAGGESRRMGFPKPLAPYRGKPLVSYVFSEMSRLCGRILIISGSGDFSEFEAEVVPDRYSGSGPAAGIEAGLSHCRTALAIIAPCDSPNLSAALFQYLLDQHGDFEITIPSHDGITEPLTGVFSPSVVHRFKEALETGNARPPAIIRSCRWQSVPVGPGQNFYRPDLFINLNTPQDLTR